MKWMECNGASLRYRDEGSGVPLVLVHEFGGMIENWDGFLEHYPGPCRVVTYDMRGAGLSSKIKGEQNIGTFVEDLKCLLDLIGVKDPANIVGCAFGGTIAMHFAATHPDRVLKTVVSSPAIEAPEAAHKTMLDRANMAEELGMASVEDGVLPRSYPEEYRKINNFQQYRLRWLSNDPFSFAAIQKMMTRLKAGPMLRALSTPTIVIGGTSDPIFPPDMVKSWASQSSSCEFHVMDTGHFAHLQTPAALAQKAANVFGAG